MGVDNLVAIGADCRCEQDSCIHRRGVELNRIADRYYDRLLRFFRRRSRSVEDAADLAQDTFARLWSTDLRQIRKPESFLFTTALNLLRDRARSAQVRHAALSVPAEEEQLVCPAPQAERVLDGEQQIEVLEAALAELSPRCRTVFEQYHFEDRSQKGIADEHGISVSMVEKYVRQAVVHCQKRLDESSAIPNQTQKLVLRASAATAALCAIVCCIVGYLHTQARNLYATVTGETRPLDLEDGSRIVLDTQSRLRVSYTDGGRDIDLLEGQAHFEVARDSRRPFRVHTPTAEIVAVGTKFDVAILPDRTSVTLIEGKVNVRTLRAAETPVTSLIPGEQVQVTSEGRLLDQPVVNIENVTAWQRRTLVLDDVPLPEALAQMNRYSVTQIVISGPDLQAKRVSGVFRVGDVETEALAVQRYFGLREVSHSDREIVLQR
jgi:transmembrane sensor